MKNRNSSLIIICFINLCFSGSIYSEEIKESKLKVEWGKVLFTLTKEMMGEDHAMTGLADSMTGSIDMNSKKVEFKLSVTRSNFNMTGVYKYANGRMHETYMESDKFSVINLVGNIAAYDPKTGTAKVVGKLTMHGITNDITVEGNITPSSNGKGYLLTASLDINLTHYGIEVPNMKMARVKEIVNIKTKIELSSAE